MRVLFVLVSLLILGGQCGVERVEDGATDAQPSLVVIISLDQFRSDYFARFQPFFGDAGFRRFIDSGAVFTNVRYRHAATMTCPGHAAISTGTSADVNGIVANDWFDVDRHVKTYCAEDRDEKLLGLNGQGRSPRLLLADTIGDILKKASEQSRVFTVAGKDRSAIMLAGHDADAAYWLQDSLITSSTFYMSALPDWVQAFNARRLPQAEHGRVWDRVLPVEAYENTQGVDDFWNEEDRYGLGKVFPHVIDGGSDRYDRDFYEALRRSPFEDEILLQFVKDLIRRERVGTRGATDLVGIGFSTTDRIGHPYGPDSHEIMDNVVRTDRILSDLFGFLDQEIGMNHVLVVLTADHGVQRMPELVTDPDKGVWGDRISSTVVRADISNLLDEAFGTLATASDWIDQLYYPHLYLNRAALAEKEIDLADAVDVIAKGLPRLERYSAAVPATELTNRDIPERYSSFPGRSGDLLIRLADHHINRGSEFGTTHGTPWDGDQHVPMLWLGASIQRGTFADSVRVIDLAPTLAHLLGLERSTTMSGETISALVAAP